MNNREWLYSLDVADLSDWFDAEHVENQERALDGDTDAQNGDSRELILTDLEKKTREWHDYDGNFMRIYSGVAYAQMKELLDRQAAITERDATKRHELFCETCEATTDKQIAELTAERDKLQELNEYHALQYELASEDCDRLQAQVDELKAERVKLRSQICKLEDDLVRTRDERDNWKANCEDWKNHARAAENACYETMLERERYRSKFGKCLDYADAIHALMDEGMA